MSLVEFRFKFFLCFSKISECVFAGGAEEFVFGSIKMDSGVANMAFEGDWVYGAGVGDLCAEIFEGVVLLHRKFLFEFFFVVGF